jgi:hypothetical protein
MLQRDVAFTAASSPAITPALSLGDELRNARKRILPTEVANSRSRARIFEALQGSTTLRAELISLFGELVPEGYTERTRRGHDSAWRYWIEFCSIVGIDPTCFGRLPSHEPQASLDQLREEDDILGAFAVFVVFYPRKGREPLNTAKYAENVIAGVRSCCEAEYHRRPGVQVTGRNGPTLRGLIKALHKRAPSKKRPRFPTMPHHLRALRRTLDLRRSARDRRFWLL